MPRQANPGQDRKTQILLAARHLVFSEGVSSLTMKRVGEAVAITEPAVYRHFRNREDLIRSLITFMFDGWEEKLLALKEKPVPASEKLIRLGKIHLSHLMDHQFNPVLLLSEAGRSEQPSIAAALNEKGERIAAVMVSILREGMAAGEFAPDLNVKSATLALFGVLQGSLIRWTLSKSARGLSPDLEGALRLILKGLSCPAARGKTCLDR
ncbi:MAG: TetR/AcrR family transcriptional regulator [Candidatus Riflebacteria bacterium]|nr:TetR/AcrR family transcriptional regulator [Candidatus Riflebacteria bacterium]